MTTFLLGWIVLSVVGTGVTLFAAWRAPVGFEDETGFHLALETKTPEPKVDFSGTLPAYVR